MTRTNLGLFLLLMFTAFSIMPVNAEIREAENDIADRRTEKLLDAMRQSPLHFPETLSTSQEVYLLVTTGASVLDVRLLAQPAVDPKRLARLLERVSTDLTHHSVLVEWTKEDDFAAAHFVLSQGHYGRREARQTIPYGRYAEALRQENFVPHILLRLPRYADFQPAPLEQTPASHPPLSFGTKNYHWFNVSDCLPRAEVEVHTAYKSLEYGLAILFPFFVPLVAGLGFAAAILAARNRSIPIETRRRIYPKLALWPTFGAIAVHAPFAIFYLASQSTLKMADLWFGSTTASGSVGPLLFLGLPVLLIIFPFTQKVELRLFGANENAPPKPVQSAEETALTRKIKRLSLIPFGVCLTMIYTENFFLPRHSPLHPFWFIAALLCNVFGPKFITRHFRRRLKEFSPETNDKELTRRAEVLGTKLGGQIKSVRILESASAKQYAAAQVTAAGEITISRKMMEELTDAEIDFVLAHEIAHVQARHLKKRRPLLLFALLMLTTPGILIASGQLSSLQAISPLWVPTFAILLPMIGMSILLIGNSRLSKLQEFEADQAALAITSDLNAAESALKKMAKFSLLPYAHEVELLSTHPQLSRRFAALQQIAQKRGLSSP